ncbi:MAG: HAD family phosphatase [Acidimicrobiales bacterium]
MIQAVVFDLDGVLLDSERVWDEARRGVVEQNGGQWRAEATGAMQGMSAREWSGYLRDRLLLDLDADRIVELVVGQVLARYEKALPTVPGASEVLEGLSRRWPLALASSSNREVIDQVLALTGWAALFRATVSSDEVARGKPFPDVYVETVRRLSEPTEACVAVEDSGNGIRSALAARLAVVAIPNRDYPPPADVLRRADRVVERLEDVTVALVEDLGRERETRREQRLDEQEAESFPASDPHSDWAGPPP